ncbi:MAG: hypothetical protein CBB68_11610 [Rhodospirillaceae bacterium TMED8]|nr:oxidoreductase [Magnetovibrio sp.]OUT49638.1 MAG: hypothetical protein CBB68_11610 [Rhodospirillaceae bacterium TMED8]|tara:strand:- start:53 stop:352 length:300 start_codon:yes stop_codon:yes gene_type:complete
MSESRIYKPTKTAMQSGQRNTKQWVLEFEPEHGYDIDTLMGWIGSTDMRQQVKLKFNSKQDAVTFAERHGIDYQVHTPKQRRLRPKNYSDNYNYKFRFE